MPNCFQLSRKTEPQTPIPFNTIDKEVCAHLAEPVDSVHWCYDWYNVIGFMLACGKTFAEVKESVKVWSDEADYNNKLLAIANFLDSNFTADSWVEIGRRH